MQSLWRDDEAARFEGELALRVYTSRLLGRDLSEGATILIDRRRELTGIEGESLVEIQVIEGAVCVDYFRHGFGRGLPGAFASRCIQACTSSAR